MPFTLPPLPFLAGSSPTSSPYDPRPVEPAGRRRRKFPDLCRVAITSVTMPRDDDFATPGLNPIGFPSGMVSTEKRGTTVVLTLHPVRTLSTNCVNHAGTMIVGGDGYCRPAMCGGGPIKPFFDQPVGVGEFFAARDFTHYGQGQLHKGHVYGVVPVQGPDTFIGTWTGHPGSGLPG